jgi:hypothetical protein
MGTYQTMMLKTGWPFNQPIPPSFKVENSIEGTLATKVALGHMLWTSAMGELFRYDQSHGNTAQAAQVAEAMVLQYPQSPDFYRYADSLNTALKNYSKAVFYAKKLSMLSH